MISVNDPIILNTPDTNGAIFNAFRFHSVSLPFFLLICLILLVLSDLLWSSFVVFIDDMFNGERSEVLLIAVEH